MDAFGGVVFDELWGRVIRVDLDLINSRYDLKLVNNSYLEWRRKTTLHDGSLSNFSRCVMPKLETPMFRTLPVAGSFCISCHVLM